MITAGFSGDSNAGGSAGVLFFFISIFILSPDKISAQETVFQILQNDLKKADLYYVEGSYNHALHIYRDQEKKAGNAKDIMLKIARCFYFLHQYANSLAWFEKYLAESKNILSSDRFLFAEVLSACKKYPEAIDQYQEYLKLNPDDDLVLNKVWRLKNIQYLYEDSLHYSVRRTSFNTDYAEFGAVALENGLVFLSNRKGSGSFEKPDALTGELDFKMFVALNIYDPVTTLQEGFGKALPFQKGLDARFHNGPLSFYEKDTKVVLTHSSEKTDQNGRRTLQLSFAEKTSKGWKIGSQFPYNSVEYSITEPFITRDGLTLYFSSDMKGGYGGKDIYKSEFKSGQWTKPVNLGELINTKFEESFPYLEKQQLYFSSNGHAGMGGFDIFKVNLTETGAEGVTNLGYPVNSNADDFGLTYNEKGDIAYFTSNREGSDDIYEVEIDLQVYPLLITGVLKTKEFSLKDSTSLKLLTGAKMYLIDHSREIIVDEIVTDETGKFQLDIPYFSQYKIKVVEKDGTEIMVSLHIPRQRKTDYNHEIVVVKDAFHTQEE
jgi:hypothetical protein